MAIQIFVVLFVLLAVAMLVLRLVSEQTQSQIKVINEDFRQFFSQRWNKIANFNFLRHDSCH